MNSMKSIFESVIRRGGYDLIGLLNRIDSYHVDGKLTDDERTELYELARGGARAEDSVDLFAKVNELSQALAEAVKRIEALEKQLDGGAENPDAPAETLPGEYAPGRWYYRGDRVTFGGRVYVCTAPDGQVCTWSPEEYPAYWEEESPMQN